jgi:DNA-binding transcriptional ArsR family regulator
MRFELSKGVQVRVLPAEQSKALTELRVELAVSPACELLLSLCVFDIPSDERDLYESGPSWSSAVEQAASPELLRDLREFATPHSHTWAGLLGLAWATPAPGDVPAFLTYLETIDALALRLQMLQCVAGEHLKDDLSSETVEAAARGEEKAILRLGDLWCGEDRDARESLRRVLSMDAEEAKRRIIDLLSRWYEEVFRAEEQRVVPILRRDAEVRRHQLKCFPAERVIELATNGISHVPTPGLNRVVLIPSVLMRPWVMIVQHGDARIYCHPVADESLTVDRDAPPVHLLRLYEALADERRLRIVRRLAREPMTLQEMADFLGIAKSTMHHHLFVLRGAGLLQTETGSKRYGLRRDALSDLSGLLTLYVDEPSS